MIADSVAMSNESDTESVYHLPEGLLDADERETTTSTTSLIDADLLPSELSLEWIGGIHANMVVPITCELFSFHVIQQPPPPLRVLPTQIETQRFLEFITLLHRQYLLTQQQYTHFELAAQYLYGPTLRILYKELYSMLSHNFDAIAKQYYEAIIHNHNEHSIFFQSLNFYKNVFFRGKEDELKPYYESISASDSVPILYHKKAFLYYQLNLFFTLENHKLPPPIKESESAFTGLLRDETHRIEMSHSDELTREAFPLHISNISAWNSRTLHYFITVVIKPFLPFAYFHQLQQSFWSRRLTPHGVLSACSECSITCLKFADG